MGNPPPGVRSFFAWIGRILKNNLHPGYTCYAEAKRHDPRDPSESGLWSKTMMGLITELISRMWAWIHRLFRSNDSGNHTLHEIESITVRQDSRTHRILWWDATQKPDRPRQARWIDVSGHGGSYIVIGYDNYRQGVTTFYLKDVKDPGASRGRRSRWI